MLTLKRFRELADSYGANLRRWPEELRSEAQALLNVSAEARALLDEARALDGAIQTASAFEDARHWRAGEQVAALARLRCGVAARIASSTVRELPGAQWIPSIQPRLAGMAAASGGAVMAGLLIGWVYVSEPAMDGVLAMLLQPAPIDLLSD